MLIFDKVRVFRNISLSIAMLIVLVHGFVPHYHEDELSFDQHESYHDNGDQDLLDRIALAFHEQFFSEDQRVFDLSNSDLSVTHDLTSNNDFGSLSCFSFSPEVLLVLKEKEAFADVSAVLIQKDLLKGTGLRAPPVLNV
ncbi:MAG: hypothetical protein EP333_02165 [Bacteroidetes bacterium]|nr:MAG: hypothetical protein EP333_02165 [Bacteroidota bacterium]